MLLLLFASGAVYAAGANVIVPGWGDDTFKINGSVCVHGERSRDM